MNIINQNVHTNKLAGNFRSFRMSLDQACAKTFQKLIRTSNHEHNVQNRPVWSVYPEQMEACQKRKIIYSFIFSLLAVPHKDMALKQLFQQQQLHRKHNKNTQIGLISSYPGYTRKGTLEARRPFLMVPC